MMKKIKESSIESCGEVNIVFEFKNKWLSDS